MTSGNRINIEPIVREGASERLVQRLLAMVKAGNLKPGDRLPGERELAEFFNVSRPTMREAIKALIVLGVLRSRHGGGIFVSPLEASDLLGPITFFLSLREIEINRLYEARSLIEGEIAALATQRSGPGDADRLAELIEQQERVLHDPIAYREADTRFHRLLADLAGNPFLSRAAESMNVLGLEFRKIASETPNVIGGSVLDHKRIVAALRAEDPEAARQAMHRHMERVLRSTKKAERLREAS